MRLSRLADEKGIARLERNRPGTVQVYVDVSGDLERFEAMLYAGWMASWYNPTISRSELQRLFNRDESTLRKWEQDRLEGALTVRKNFAQTAAPQRYEEYVPDHAQYYEAATLWRRGRVVKSAKRVRWQISNTYQSTIRKHEASGKARKVRRAVNATLDFPGDSRAGTQRRYFDDTTKLRKAIRQHNKRVGLGVPSVFEADFGVAFIALGVNRRGGYGVFEIADTPFTFTRANEYVGYLGQVFAE